MGSLGLCLLLQAAFGWTHETAFPSPPVHSISLKYFQLSFFLHEFGRLQTVSLLLELWDIQKLGLLSQYLVSTHPLSPLCGLVTIKFTSITASLQKP